jgi:hypothetical protein
VVPFKPRRGGNASVANVSAILTQFFGHSRRIHIAQIDLDIRVIVHKPLQHGRQDHLSHRRGHRQPDRPEFGLLQAFYRRNSVIKMALFTLGLSQN